MEYFTERLTRLEYSELPVLAPDAEMFKQYREDGDWPVYEARYQQLLADRRVAQEIDETLFSGGAVLLCTEPTADKCHRRLAAEYLRDELLTGASVVHL